MSHPNTGGIVLCGGQSRRMGTPKHALPFGDETMLQHVVGIVAQVVQPVVVVRAPEMELPELPKDVLIAEDADPGLGPLAGLSTGLEALKDRCDAAFATACDVPLLKPAVIRRLIEAGGDCDVAVYRDGRHYHPLAAVYSTALLPRIRQHIAEGRLRLFDLILEARPRAIDVSDVRHLDPNGDSFRNANTPEEYEALLSRQCKGSRNS